MPSNPPYPVGLPLTESMEFTGRDGTSWLVYIEAVPPPPRSRWRSQTLLPARRLRFDSVRESRIVTPVPAGAPFLTDVRLQGLLDRSAPLDLSGAGEPARPQRRHDVRRSAGHEARSAASLLAEGRQRWSRGAEGRRAFRSRVEAGAVLAADRVVAWVAGLLKGRPRAGF